MFISTQDVLLLNKENSRSVYGFCLSQLYTPIIIIDYEDFKFTNVI